MISFSTILGPTSSYFAWSMTSEQITQIHDWCQRICKYITSPYDSGDITPITDATYDAFIENGSINRMYITFTSQVADEHQCRFNKELRHTLDIYQEKFEDKMRFFPPECKPMYNPPRIFLDNMNTTAGVI
jgi:hypothetical protein